MGRLGWLLVMMLTAGVTIASCGGVQERYALKDRPFATKSQPTLDQITQAILQSGPPHLWKLKVVRPGLIEGRRDWGNGRHGIVVDVVYDTKQYRIDLKSTKNLNQSGNTVHRAYNRETIRLYDEIYRQTSKL